MAIIIPSKKIYNVSNPKVLENALSRIDVSQNDVKTIETTEGTERLSMEKKRWQIFLLGIEKKKMNLKLSAV